MYASIQPAKPSSICSKRYYDLDSNVFFCGLPEMIPNRILNSESTTVFMNASSDQLSLLQPTLKFFISSKSGDVLVYFSDFVLGERMLEYQSLRSQGELKRITEPASLIGMNVGIKSFSWNYDNKHEGDRIVKANLSLHFGSMLDLLNENYLEFIHTNIAPRPNDIKPDPKEKEALLQWYKKRLDAREKTLANGTDPSLPGEAKSKMDADDASFKQLKVIVGYSIPENSDTTLLDEKFLKAVSESQRTLVLKSYQVWAIFQRRWYCWFRHRICCQHRHYVHLRKNRHPTRAKRPIPRLIIHLLKLQEKIFGFGKKRIEISSISEWVHQE